MPKVTKSWWRKARDKDKAQAKKKAAQKQARDDEIRSETNKRLRSERSKTKEGKVGFWGKRRAIGGARKHMEDRYGLFWEDKGMTAEELRKKTQRKK